MPEHRLDDYLTGLDAAEQYHWFPPSFDEWQAIRLQTGREPGTFNRYLTELSRAEDRRYHDVLVQFGAIDDDDFIPDEECNHV